jgi:starch-binding outer membrane protein, SusD/RagB family
MHWKKTFGFLAAGVLVTGCLDMDIDNPNAPDADAALAEPGDVESLLATGFYRYWNGTQKTNPGMGLAVVGGDATSSWGNFGMEDLGTIPRQAWDNSPTYVRGLHNRNPWSNLYEAISNVRDGLLAIEGGLRFVDEETGRDETPRAQAYAKFVQGVTHGWLALMYDRAFIVDETTDLEAMGDPASYQDVMRAALGYLDEAIAISEANSFQLPGGDNAWIHGRELTNTELAQWAHSFAARYKAAVARTPTERQQVNWTQVLHHLDRGVRVNDGPQGDGAFWWFATGWYPHDWIRASYWLIGPADPEAFANWRAQSPQDRQPFLIETDDRRITGPEGPRDPGKYVRFVSTSNVFPVDRGMHFQSYYYFSRFDYHIDTGARGPLPLFLEAEHDLLRAEAHLRLGQRDAAIDLINNSRVGTGELPPLPHGAPEGEVWEALFYEKPLEVAHSIAGLVYFERRGWGQLICGTPLHFPIHGRELELLNMPSYTFGGTAGDAANPQDGCIEP